MKGKCNTKFEMYSFCIKSWIDSRIATEITAQGQIVKFRKQKVRSEIYLEKEQLS